MSSNTKLSVNNPRTGIADYFFAEKSAAEISLLCRNLREAQRDWQARGVAQRIETMQQWKSAIVANKAEITAAITTDTGRYSESALEADLLLSSIDRWCGIARDFFAESPEKQSLVPFVRIQQAVVPYPLVGVISPWNFPLLLSIIDAIPALLAGCAVVVKPSEITPRFIAPLQKSIEMVPALAAVFQYIAGAGPTGEHIIGHSDLICFTGSVDTGKKVYAQCARLFKPCFLELGGKDPALVFEGTDLDLATSSILWGSTVNCGHSCLSIERIYVQSSIFEAFVAQLVEKAAKIKLAYPTPSDGQIGPVISERQVRIIDQQLQNALEQGAVLRTGNRACVRMDGGWYCRPTVLTKVHHDMSIMNEETFGPIMPVMPFDSEDEAIALANGTVYGLSGAVFARNWEEAYRIGQRLECGAVSINDCALTAIVHEGEKNSFKQSGIGGTRMGPSAIKRFMRQKAFLIKKENVPSPWHF